MVGALLSIRPVGRPSLSSLPFNRANELLTDTNWEQLLDTPDVNQALQNWESIFMSIMESCIPKCTLPRRKNLPWLSKNLKRAMQKRNTLFRRAKSSGSAEIWRKYKGMRNKVTSMLRDSKQSFFTRHINNGNKKQFWKTMKYLRKEQSTIPSLRSGGTSADNELDKANMLNNYFSTCFNTSLPPLSGTFESVEHPEGSPDDLLCTEDEVVDLLHTIDVSKASGHDKISGRMLKATAASIATPVTELFNKSISTGCFPKMWKRSNVVPIPKSGDKGNPANYRPISLLPVLSKLLERHIANVLLQHLTDKQQISASQWGFHSRKSTVTALLETTHNWFELLEHGKEVGAVFFDFRKAFDSVPHRALIEKLENLQVNHLLVKWIHSYLSAREQQVVVNGSTSDTLPVLSGVPQGSVLGPLLFLSYIDGITSITISPESQLTLYADDMLLYRPISNSADYAYLQDDINRISEWVEANYLQFNTQKCKFMRVTRKRPGICPPTLYLCCQPLQEVDSYKYLGILLSSDLSWAQHIQSICGKAKKLVGLIYRRFSQHSSPESLLQMYVALARPHLEYASPVWSTSKGGEINSLDNIQKFALRMCAKQWETSYDELLQLFSLPSLQDRRLYLDLCTMFKIVHGLFHFPPGIFVEQPPRVTRSQSYQLYVPPYTHTSSFYNSYIPRTIHNWNMFISHASSPSYSVSSFKRNFWTYMQD